MDPAAAPTRDKILEQARDLYLEEGLRGFSMRKVAARVGISATAIYRHFEHKEALLGGVVDAGFHLFARYQWRALEGATARERLQRSGEAYLRFALDHPAYYRVMFLSSRDEVGPRAPSPEQARRGAATFQFLVDRIRECQDEGAIGPGDPHELAVSLWGTSHGLVSLYLTGHLRSRHPDDASFARAFHAARARWFRDAGSPALATVPEK